MNLKHERADCVATWTNSRLSLDSQSEQQPYVVVWFHVQETVHRIVKEAVDLEHEFCCTALPVSLVGMNAALMGQYIEYVADRLLVELGCEKLYNSLNPFDWMEMISLQVRSDTKSLSAYQHLLGCRARLGCRQMA